MCLVLLSLASLSCSKTENSASQNLTLAVEALEKHDYREAKIRAALVLASDLSNPLAVEISAISLRMLGDQPEAFRMRQYQSSLPPRSLTNEELALKSRIARLEAAFLHQTVSSCAPEALRYADAGGILARQRKFDEADALLARAIQVSPNCEPAYFNRAVMAYERGDDRAARQYATQVLRINPANEQAKKMLGLIR
jgi:Tfp pilus assembly protein PilF